MAGCPRFKPAHRLPQLAIGQFVCSAMNLLTDEQTLRSGAHIVPPLLMAELFDLELRNSLPGMGSHNDATDTRPEDLISEAKSRRQLEGATGRLSIASSGPRARAKGETMLPKLPSPVPHPAHMGARRDS